MKFPHAFIFAACSGGLLCGAEDVRKPLSERSKGKVKEGGVQEVSRNMMESTTGFSPPTSSRVLSPLICFTPQGIVVCRRGLGPDMALTAMK